MLPINEGGHGGARISKTVRLVLLFFSVFLGDNATRSISSTATIMNFRKLASTEVFPNEHQPERARNSNISSSFQAHTNSSSGRATEWTDDSREQVRTQPYNNKRVAYISHGSFNKGPERFQIMIIDSLRTWLKDNVIFYDLNNQWTTDFEEACNELTNREECKRIVPIFVDCPGSILWRITLLQNGQGYDRHVGKLRSLRLVQLSG
jgi:hypothetical protein